MLVIFSGLPGTGKSTLAAALSRRHNAVYLRVDTIEQALRDAGVCADGPAGYCVAYRVASENLRLGLSVVADSVNPLAVTRQAWRGVALRNNVRFVEIEVICSDPDTHRSRVETRGADVPGLSPPTWREVQERVYELWETNPVVIDTARHTPEDSVRQLIQTLEKAGSAPH